MSVNVGEAGRGDEWESMLVPVKQFPAPQEQAASLKTFLAAFRESVLADPEQQHEVLLQTWKLGPGRGSEVLHEHLKEWKPELGLGIWPDRKPPQGWTEERFVNAAAAAFRSAEPQLPSHRLLRLAGKSSARVEAAARMTGFGTMVEMFGHDSYEKIAERGRKLYLPGIMERRFQRETFYLPLLDRETLRTARTPAQLATWLCGVDIYVRESPEDGGLLIVSRKPLAPILERTQYLIQRKGKS